MSHLLVMWCFRLGVPSVGNGASGYGVPSVGYSASGYGVQSVGYGAKSTINTKTGKQKY